MLNAVPDAEAAIPDITVTASPRVLDPVSGTTITYTLSNTASSEVVLTIADASGNIVMTVNTMGVIPGTYTYIWDGKDSGGNRIPDGSYNVTVRAATKLLDGADYVLHSVFVYGADEQIFATASSSPSSDSSRNPGILLVNAGGGGVMAMVPGFDVPFGIDIFDVGGVPRIYVTDYHGDNTTIFSGSFGDAHPTVISTPGEPVGIANDSTGNIYVAELLSDKVQIFDEDGNFLRDINVPQPFDVAVDGAGKIYVTSSGYNSVTIFNPDGSLNGPLGAGTNVSGSGNYEFNSPMGIALDGSGNIYVADSMNSRIQVFNPRGQYLYTFIISGGAGYTSYPQDIAFDSNDNMYIIDNGNLLVSYAPGQTTVVVDDYTPPTVTCTLSGTAQNGWYRTSVDVAWTATDISGIKSLLYGFDNATWYPVPPTGHITLSSECSTTVYWNCLDNNGNVAYGNKEVRIDRTAPVLEAEVLSPAPNVNGWYNCSVWVNFTASDAMSGLASITPNVTLTGEGPGQSASCTATDNAGNSASKTIGGINIDKTAPTTTASLSGRTGNNGWYTGVVRMNLSASDGLSGPGSTGYSTDGGKTWTLYTAPAILSSEGTGTIYYRSTDTAGNVEAARSISIKIDKTAPEIIGTLSGNKSSSGWFEGDATLTLSYSDATSGIGSVMYSPDGSRWSAYTKPVTLPMGVSHSVYFGAADLAGNQKNGSAFVYFSPAALGYVSYSTPASTIIPLATPISTITPSAAPTTIATPMSSPTPEVQSNGFPWWLLLVLLATVVIAGAAYYLFFRNR